MSVSVSPASGDGVAVLEAVGTAENIRHILECCGQAVENAAVRSARAKGGRSFWGDVANSVSHQMDGGSMVVGASHFAAGFKQTGGIIRAPGHGAGSLHSKALTIPVGIARGNHWDTDEAGDAGYELFRNKDVLFGRLRGSGKGGGRGRGKKKGNGGGDASVPLFVLRRQVVQKPDPWFPEGAALSAAIDEAVEFFATRNGGAPVQP